MISALQLGKPFVHSTSPTTYANPLTCEMANFNCYLESITRCDAAWSHGRQADGQTKCALSTEERNATGPARISVAPSFAAVWASLDPAARASRAWVRAVIARYLLRPNAALRANVARLEHTLELDAPGAYARTAAVHIRHGDKWHESRLVPTENYARVLGYLHMWHGVETAFVGTDDPQAVSQIREELAARGLAMRVVELPAREFVLQPSNRGAAGRMTHLFTRQQRAQARQQRAQARQRAQAHMSKSSSQAGTPDAGAEPDEGRTMLSQILMFARCEWMIGTLSSNIGRLVYLLRYGETHAGLGRHFIDMDGNEFTACPARKPWPVGSNGRRAPPLDPETALLIKTQNATIVRLTNRVHELESRKVRSGNSKTKSKTA
eukprot:CAMPEP_0185157836 /NCGR_PEP_ID=MMETSP1139-20130426/2026_1 /TAXON_ID=298111 /ORGANISM="Pavlova sp., Strain CCMP459" /LENGTH=379 /DNA_ID=CAMNT_0027722941 /DNA_START=229 /DNA_END=1368 /DNA_ORIENTATION=+